MIKRLTLIKDLILSQCNGEDSYKAYREKVQKYSEEESNVFENLRHGIVFGTKRDLNKITKKHLKKESGMRQKYSRIESMIKAPPPLKIAVFRKGRAGSVFNQAADHAKRSEVRLYST